MTWRFASYDLATGVSRGALRLTSWSSTDQLNDSGSWSATVAPPDDADEARTNLTATEPGMSLILAMRNGAIVFSGFLPPGGRRRTADTIDLAGSGLLGYLDRRTLNVSSAWTRTLVDQHFMVAELVDYATDNGGVQIRTDTVAASGRLRTQTWQPWERKNIGEAIRQKSALIGGFDFDVRAEAAGTVVVRQLRCWYPRRGLSIASGGPVFEVGANVPEMPDIGGNEDYANVITGLGSETNSTTQARLLVTAGAPVNLSAPSGFPEYDYTLDLNDVKDLTSLQEHADGEARLRGIKADPEITFRVDPTSDPFPWGSWDLGSSCRFIIPAGEYATWPDGSSQNRRITAHQWSWSADGTEELAVTTGLDWAA